MEQVMAWVKKLAVFMILCSYMEHLIPSQYQRYFHMCTGLILILMITSPLVQILQGDMGSEVLYLLENLKTGSSPLQTVSEDQEIYRQYYMAQYRKAVEEQIRYMAEMEGLKAGMMDLTVDKDWSGENFGHLKEVSVDIVSENGNEVDNREKKQLKKTLSQQLGLAESHIHLNEK